MIAVSANIIASNVDEDDVPDHIDRAMECAKDILRTANDAGEEWSYTFDKVEDVMWSVDIVYPGNDPDGHRQCPACACATSIVNKDQAGRTAGVLMKKTIRINKSELKKRINSMKDKGTFSYAALAGLLIHEIAHVAGYAKTVYSYYGIQRYAEGDAESIAMKAISLWAKESGSSRDCGRMPDVTMRSGYTGRTVKSCEKQGPFREDPQDKDSRLFFPPDPTQYYFSEEGVCRDCYLFEY
ncbi:hypothetical protein ACFL6Y_03030 [Elusimicrobiota bacterium]